MYVCRIKIGVSKMVVPFHNGMPAMEKVPWA